MFTTRPCLTFTTMACEESVQLGHVSAGFSGFQDHVPHNGDFNLFQPKPYLSAV